MVQKQHGLLGRNDSRIDIADILRGLAVMGIVILHSIEHFNFYSFPDTSFQSSFLNFTDKAIWDSLFFTFGGKAYAVFALLFGFSFFIQDNNQLKKGKDFRLRFLWRLFLLFLIGNFNAMFFTAEILVMYSLIGIILVLTCRLSDRIILLLSILLLLQPIALYNIINEIISPSDEPVKNMVGYYWKKTYAAQANGNFWETIKVNLYEGQMASLTWAWKHGRIFQTAALFMLGMFIGRRKLFKYSVKNIKIWGCVLTIAFIMYFPLIGLTNMLPDFITNKNLLFSSNLIIKSLANFSFMLILVSGIIILFYTFSKVKSTLMLLSPYGRMSLTNYLTQSIFGSMFFYNWGFALHNKLGVTYSFFFGIMFFLCQFLFCKWWMKSHTHGPFEYLWKKATWVRLK